MRETRPLELEDFMSANSGRGSRFDAVDQHGKKPNSSASNVSKRSPGASSWWWRKGRDRMTLIAGSNNAGIRCCGINPDPSKKPAGCDRCVRSCAPDLPKARAMVIDVSLRRTPTATFCWPPTVAAFTKKATVAFMRIDPGLIPMLSIGTATALSARRSGKRQPGAVGWLFGGCTWDCARLTWRKCWKS